MQIMKRKSYACGEKRNRLKKVSRFSLLARQGMQKEGMGITDDMILLEPRYLICENNIMNDSFNGETFDIIETE